jgi:hypothetical protein
MIYQPISILYYLCLLFGNANLNRARLTGPKFTRYTVKANGSLFLTVIKILDANKILL